MNKLKIKLNKIELPFSPYNKKSDFSNFILFLNFTILY